MTIRGTVHQLLGALAFTLMPAAGIVLAWRWRRKAEWRGLIQRGILVPFMLWLFTLAWRVGLVRRSQETTAA